MANIGTLAVNLVARTEKFTAKMKGAGNTVGGLRDRLLSLKPSLAAVAAGFAAAAVAAGTFVLSSLENFRQLGDDLDKMSHRTGVSVEALSKLRFAAQQAGTDITTLEKGLFGLSRSLFDAFRGSTQVMVGLKELGFTYQQLDKLSPEEQFMAVGKSLANYSNISKRGAIAQLLLGRAGRQLLPMFNDLSVAIERATELNIGFSTSSAKAAAELTDVENELARSFENLKIQIGALVVDDAISITRFATDATQSLSSFSKETKGAAGALSTVLGKALFKVLPLTLQTAIIWGKSARAADALKESVEELSRAQETFNRISNELFVESVQDFVKAQKKSETAFNLVKSIKLADELSARKRDAKARLKLDAFLEKGRARRESEQESFLSRGLSLAQAGRRPFQVMADDMRELNEQFMAGNLSLDAMRRLAEDSAKSFRDARAGASVSSTSTPGTGAVTRGSVAGFSAVASAGRERQTQIARQQLTTQQSMDRTLQAIENNLPEQIEINEININ